MASAAPHGEQDAWVIVSREGNPTVVATPPRGRAGASTLARPQALRRRDTSRDERTDLPRTAIAIAADQRMVPHEVDNERGLRNRLRLRHWSYLRSRGERVLARTGAGERSIERMSRCLPVAKGWMGPSSGSPRRGRCRHGCGTQARPAAPCKPADGPWCSPLFCPTPPRPRTTKRPLTAFPL